MEAADEMLLFSAGALGALGRVDQPPAPMRADVVIGANFIGRGAHDEYGVIENIVGEVVSHLGNFLDPTCLQPHFAPQLVAFRAGIMLGNVGFRAYGERF